jgi:PAS domain S-box-containing protein
MTSFLDRTSDADLIALLVASDDAVIVADPAGAIRFWNTAAERMFGRPAEEAIGASLDLIIPEKLRARHWEGYRTVMQTGETSYAGRMLAVPAVRADGSRISVEFTVTLLRDASGAVSGIGAILRDVTERWEERRALQDRVRALECELDACRRGAATPTHEPS